MSDLVNRAVNAASSGVKYVQDTLAGQSAEAQAEVDKNVVTSEHSTIGQKIDSAGSYVSNKVDQKSNEASAEVHKQDAKHS